MKRAATKRRVRRCIATLASTGERCTNPSPFHRDGYCKEHRRLIYQPWNPKMSRERINELAWADWDHISQRPKVKP